MIPFSFELLRVYVRVYVCVCVCACVCVGCCEDHGQRPGQDQEVRPEVLRNENAAPGCRTPYSGELSPCLKYFQNVARQICVVF